MATEGQFPKADGDILFASEVNDFAIDFMGETIPTINANRIRVTNRTKGKTWAGNGNENILEDGNSYGIGPRTRGTSGKLKYIWDLDHSMHGLNWRNDKFYGAGYRVVEDDDYEFRGAFGSGGESYQYGSFIWNSSVDYIVEYDTYFEDAAYGLTPTTGNAEVLLHDATDTNATSGSGTGTIFEVDLGSLVTLNCISALVQSYSSSSGYRGVAIEHSQNGSTWTTLSLTGGNTKSTRYTTEFYYTVNGVPGTDVRYIRVTNANSGPKVSLLCAWKVA
tara:strand:+ start:980 stop:1810 length:831 start_codon:yes stop_codon:yes gene_type:complete